MPKLKPEDLDTIKERVIKESTLKEGAMTARIVIHGGTCGVASGALEVMDVVNEEVKASGRDDIKVSMSGCIGICSQEPIITVQRLGETQIRYDKVSPDKMKKIFQEHVLGGEIPVKLAMAKGSEHRA